MRSDELLAAMNENRLLVFLECSGEDCEEGEGHHFHQVILTAAQFKKVSDACIVSEKPDPTLKEGYNLAELKLGGTFAPESFDGLSSFDI